MSEARGSSSSSSALVELARRGIAPRAIILGRPDAILAIGALVAEQLYGQLIPIVVLPSADTHQLKGNLTARVRCSAASEVADISLER